MASRKFYCKLMRVLATGVLFAGASFAPLAGEASLPRHPQPSGNAADRIWNQRRNETVSAGNASRPAPQQRPAAAVKPRNHTVQHEPASPVSGTMGYTEAELRERLAKKYIQPKPEFRRVSGAVAGADYRPGTMDVKIPSLFFPPDEVKDVSETFAENPDGTFGVRAPDDRHSLHTGYSSAARQQLQEEQRRRIKAAPGGASQPKGTAGYNRGNANPKYKTVTIQVPVPAPSPFRALTNGDFRWFTNSKGHYVVALPSSLPQNPLQGLPADGPMAIRNASQSEFMAVTSDDPSDTYYYKNQDTFPNYGKAVPVYTETRKNIQGDDVAIKYIRYYLGGQYCIIVDSAGKRGVRTYRAAFVFPESKQYEYLPKALYAIENLKGL